jgi:hypothetical protein
MRCGKPSPIACQWALLGALLAALSALPACGPQMAQEPHATSALGRVCAPGDRRSCACGGVAGTQYCLESGEGFEGCSCEGETPDGGTGNAPPTSGCGTCDGCCRGSVCIPFANQTASLCGKRGQACSSCDDGGVCDTETGSCANPTPGACNAATCPNGCCSANGCVTSPDWAQCGSGGRQCRTCDFGGTLCQSDGSCSRNELDPNEYFYLSVRSIQVQSRTWDWSIGGTESDTYVCFEVPDVDERGAPFMRTGCTKRCDDSASCNLSASDGLVKYCYELSTCSIFCSSPKTVCDPVLFRGAALRGGQAKARVLDYDSWNSDDEIGTAMLPAVSAYHTARYATGSFGSVNRVEYEILYALP